MFKSIQKFQFELHYQKKKKLKEGVGARRQIHFRKPKQNLEKIVL